jgi:putative addiction module CopG family antidote
MPSKHNLSISLTEQLCGFIEQQVAAGRFRTASEVVRAGLRLLERDLADPPAPRDEGSDAAGRDGAAGRASPQRPA